MQNDMDLHQYVGKNLCVLMNGSGGATPGKLVAVSSTLDVFIMSTRWSTKQHFRLSNLSSFWCEEDKPEEE